MPGFFIESGGLQNVCSKLYFYPYKNLLADLRR